MSLIGLVTRLPAHANPLELQLQMQQIRLEILGGRGMGANLLACLCLDLQCLILVPLRHQGQNEDWLLGVGVFLLSWTQSPFSPKPSPKPLSLGRVFRSNLPSKSQNSALSSTPHLPSISRWWLSSPSSCSVAQSVSPQASDLVIERHLGPCVTAALKGIFSRLAAFGGGDGEVWVGGALRAGVGQGGGMRWDARE